jgi:hypothetical protein
VITYKAEEGRVEEEGRKGRGLRNLKKSKG